MNVAAFALLATAIAIYAVLDGYDLGVAAVAPFVARGSAQRAAAMESIGPFWNGNEVWLIVAGGLLFALFPRAYASAFSGFYLPFTTVLWLLMFRGISLELRNHFASDLWRGFWDTAFTGASALLAVLFGVTLGNLVRGLPLDANGYFLGRFAFLLNPYALAVGIFALLALAQHGLAFLTLRTDGELAERSRRLLSRLWWGVLLLYCATTLASLALRSGVAVGAPMRSAPLVVLSLLALGGVHWFSRVGKPGLAFAASSLFLVSLVLAAASTMYPYLLPAFPAGSGGIDITNAGSGPVGLARTLALTLPGLLAVVLYSIFVIRRMRGCPRSTSEL
uniref:Cytochrome bd ubiquinol oxidase, subunit II n=1 Tax=mine drainage metagenome TaxID=410659 RepID=E6Q5I3_9ZZZZ